ncbi:MAG: AbrB/MazE/SpoVT family DNA-binding domain-containing protein [Clostridia bacterium]|nr:AbrB/MazE/SpoVT family DNA-binding domain-containing protein [Clostridia bacterium]
MKATGIVRRIDDLGRVVIPKEIRRTMRIREGDPLEIFTNSGEVVFKKYSPMGEIIGFATDLVAAMSSDCGLIMAICDRDHCIAASAAKKELLEKSVTPELEKICEERRLYSNQNGADIFAFDGVAKKLCVAAPIVAAGDIVGCVVLLENENTTVASETEIKLAKVAAQFLASRSE